MIKVVFLKKVANLAEIGEVKTVSDGYALNYLVPQGLAEITTPAKLKYLEQYKSKLIKNQYQLENKWQHSLDLVKNQVVKITAKASVGGKLYASLTPEEIVQAVNQKLNLELEASQLVIPGHIKTLGEHMIQVVFNRNYQTSFILKVLAKDHD